MSHFHPQTHLSPVERLPAEILLHILSHLDIPTLHTLTITCKLLRSLACDPLLHAHRLRHLVPRLLSHLLPRRPTLDTLRPPHTWIYLTRTHVLARSVGRRLASIRLAHALTHRPTAAQLIARSILPPRECTDHAAAPVSSPAVIQSRQTALREKLRDRLGRKLQRRPSLSNLVELNILPEECARRSVSPALVATRRRVIRESLKDGLRAWVEGRAVQAQKRKADEAEVVERSTVKGLVKRYTARRAAEDGTDSSTDSLSREKKRAQARWGRDAELARKKEERKYGGACSQPTRAHVLGLRRFWEGVIRAAG